MKPNLSGLPLILVLLLAPWSPARAQAFPEVGHWYHLSEPATALQGTVTETSFDVKILRVAPNGWCFVLRENLKLPADKTGQVVIEQRQYWLNLAHVEKAWDTGSIDWTYYQQHYAGFKIQRIDPPF